MHAAESPGEFRKPREIDKRAAICSSSCSAWFGLKGLYQVAATVFNADRPDELDIYFQLRSPLRVDRRFRWRMRARWRVNGREGIALIAYHIER